MRSLSLRSDAGCRSRFGISAQRQARSRPPQLSFCLRTIFEGCTTNPQVSAFKRGTKFIRKQNQTWRNRAHGPARQTAMMLLWPCSPADPARFPGTDRNGRCGRWRSPQRSLPRGALHTPGMLCTPQGCSAAHRVRPASPKRCVMGGLCVGRGVRWEEGAMGRGCNERTV